MCCRKKDEKKNTILERSRSNEVAQYPSRIRVHPGGNFHHTNRLPTRKNDKELWWRCGGCWLSVLSVDMHCWMLKGTLLLLPAPGWLVLFRRSVSEFKKRGQEALKQQERGLLINDMLNELGPYYVQRAHRMEPASFGNRRSI